MNFAYLTEEKWEEFRRRFPEAHEFMLDATLREELRILRSRGWLTGWERERLRVLEGWYEEVTV